MTVEILTKRHLPTSTMLTVTLTVTLTIKCMEVVKLVVSKYYQLHPSVMGNSKAAKIAVEHIVHATIAL